MAYSRTRDSRGLNVPEYQNSSMQNVKHETVIIPSTSQVAFGAYSIFDFKEKACLINDVMLQFQVTNLNAGSVNKNTSTPRLMSAFNWFTRIEIVQNNQIIDTIYPQANFLQHQLFVKDEQRKLINDGAGDYTNSYKLFLKTQNARYWYVPLWTYFKTSHIPALYPKDDLQIRLYMDTLLNNITMGDGTNPSCTLQANLICDLTRLGQDVNLYRLQSLNRSVEHYKFLELRYGTTTIPVNSNPAPIFNYVLNAVTGNVVYLFAVVRPADYKGPGSRIYDPFQYLPVSNFSILDSTSTNITGGQPVPLSLLQQYLSRRWTLSSYYSTVQNIDSSSFQNCTDPNIVNALFVNGKYEGFNYFVGANVGELAETTSNAIMYSFSDDPITAANSGSTGSSFHFKGSEQLQVQFTAPITQPLVLDVYAYVESCVEVASTYLKKVTL